MAGRGRGRGRGAAVSFSVDSLGFGRGEALPGPLLQPPPMYPPLEMKPVPLSVGDEYDYMLALKQEYHGSMRDSVYFVKEGETKNDIERYSDKYQLGQTENGTWHPDWSRLPAELRIRTSSTRSKKRQTPAVQPVIPSVKRATIEEVTNKLEELEKKESAQSDDEEDKEDEEEGEDVEDIYEEDELEEETDYNLTYFDNGELEDEDDDLDDGPTY